MDAKIREANLLVLVYWRMRLQTEGVWPDQTAARTTPAYIYWFIIHAIERDSSPDFPLDKLGRWVGFVQGVLAANGVLDVDAERERTRPLFWTAYGRRV